MISSSHSLRSSTGNYSAMISSVASNDSDDVLDDNYISLLRYRDAYHILGLNNSGDHEYSYDEISTAYTKCRQETLMALHSANARKVNTFVMSQLNYLELKLRALDQARSELLDISENDLNAGQSVFGNDDETERASAQEELDDNGERLLQSTVPAKAPSKEDDELQTIDIYFQPNQSCKHNRTRNLSKDSTDMSSLSWLSKTDSDDNLSQVLGPLTSNKMKETSPKGVDDFPNEGRFSFEEKQYRGTPEICARQRPPKPTRSKSSNIQTIEAARKGVLRALSEDDSECLPMDDYDDSILMQVLEKTLTDSLKVEANERGEQRERKNNSPVKSEHSRNSDCSYKSTESIKRSKSPQRSRRSSLSKPSCDSQRNVKSAPASRCTTPTPSEEEYAEINMLINNRDDYYDSIMQSGMELADDICGVLNSCCWDVDGGVNTSNETDNGAIAAGRYDGANIRYREEVSYFSDEYTLGTDGESTAFNTTSSFSHAPDVRTPESYMEKRYSYKEKKMLV